jgi:hypothetical protein
VQRAIPVIERRTLEQELQLAVTHKAFEVCQHLDTISDGTLFHPSGHPEAVGGNVLEDEGACRDLGAFPGPDKEKGILVQTTQRMLVWKENERLL